MNLIQKRLMISIEHIAFDFVMQDEQFARDLYADWDRFCHDCFERVLEECLSKHDKSVKDYCIEKLDINIGRIKQETFYTEFPKRLREEIEKSLTQFNLPLLKGEEDMANYKQLSKVAYFLISGSQKVNWTDTDFNLANELEIIAANDEKGIENIVNLCTSNEYALRRLLLQSFSGVILIDIYERAIRNGSHTKDERHHLMEVFLDIRPDIAINYIRKSTDEEGLRSMADLLDTYSIRSLMYKETEEHAEVGLALYWHSLYEWLAKYYPFNGLAIFGGKSSFIKHMDYRVLTFIHKRGESATYLSKVVLTKDFLVEVFGTAYYRELLNAIYRLQPLKADGTPAYDSSEYMELYRVFMSLSLIDDNAENDYFGDDIRISAKRLAKRLKEDGVNEDIRGKLSMSFLKQFGNKTVDAMLALHEYGILDTVINSQSPTIASELARKISNTINDRNLAEYIADITEWLIYNEQTISGYIVGNSTTLRTNILLWLAKESKQSQTATVLAWNFQMFLFSIFGKDGMPLMERIILERDHNKKEENLQYIALEQPYEFVKAIRETKEDRILQEDSYTILPFEVLLQSMGRVNFAQTAILKKTIDRMRNNQYLLAVLSAEGISVDNALSSALILFMHESDTLGVVGLTEDEIKERFVKMLHKIGTRKTDFENDEKWTQIMTIAKGEEPSNFDAITLKQEGRNSENYLTIEDLNSLDDEKLIPFFTKALYGDHESVIKWLEKDISEDFAMRLSNAADVKLTRLFLTAISNEFGFYERNAYVRLVNFMLLQNQDTEYCTKIMKTMLAFIHQNGWRNWSMHRITSFFMAHIQESGDSITDIEMMILSDDNLPADTRKILFKHLLRSHPIELIRRLKCHENTGIVTLAMEWADKEDWLLASANLSLTLAETLRKCVELLTEKGLLSENEICKALAMLLIDENLITFAHYLVEKDIASMLIDAVSVIKGENAIIVDEVRAVLQEKILIAEDWQSTIIEEMTQEDAAFVISNAGLCLLSPWFVILFGRLGYLNEDRKDFRNFKYRMRAVFMLQYLAFPRSKNNVECELAFSKLLTAIPQMRILPPQIELTEEERNIADDMMKSVKDYWSQMKGTSLDGFVRSFIARKGILKEEENSWLLTVNKEPQDLLLDTVPWSFKQIRLPWMKKYVQVRWNEKQKF